MLGTVLYIPHMSFNPANTSVKVSLSVFYYIGEKIEGWMLSNCS